MSAQHSTKHNLEQYKKQAKDLLKAYQTGQSEAVELVRGHLPRLGQAADEERAEISLQEAQHVVAGKHQFKDWNWLRTVSTLDVELLLRCEDRELQTFMRDVDQKDLVVSLTGAPAALRDRLFANMSARVKNWISEEIEFLGELKPDQVKEAQRNILLQVAALAQQDQIAWPEGTRETVPDKEDTHSFGPPSPQLVTLAAMPLEQMELGEIAELWLEIAERARREGVLSLEEIETSPFVRDALALIIDGVEPDLVLDIMKTRIEHALLRGQETRGKMVIEGLMSILSNDNPRIVHHKLSTFFDDYRSPASGAEPPAQRPVQEIQADAELTRRSLAEMDYGQIAALFTEMAYLARQAGIRVLESFIDKVDYPLLRAGLERIVAEVFYADQVMADLEAQLNRELEEARVRYRAVVAGVLAVQEGKKPQEVERLVRETCV